MTGRGRSSLLPTIALLAICASWGSTFYLIHDLVDRVPVVDFLAVRFAVAAVAMLVVAPRSVVRLSPEARRYAVVLGLLYGVAQILQTTGLETTPASVSGFVTGLYVVFTPLLAAALLRTRVTRITWLAVLLAVVGLAVLTLSGISLGFGEAVTLVSAVGYALHIVALSRWSTPRDALGMSILQIVVIAALCLAVAAPGGIVLPSTGPDWWSVIYMALVAGALAMFAQTWAQSHLDASRSAIVMSTEPVFAAGFAVLLGGEGVTWRLVIGGLLVVSAMLLAELGPRRTTPTGEVPHIAV